MKTDLTIPTVQREIAPQDQRERLEQLCRDFDTDCVACDSPPFGSYRRCWEYDRSTGFCPFCLPRP
jgi:hypothetical protein